MYRWIRPVSLVVNNLLDLRVWYPHRFEAHVNFMRALPLWHERSTVKRQLSSVLQWPW